MQYVNPPPRPHLRRAQRGQVLVFGIFVAAVAAAMLFFVFNSGQLIREKTKLVNTTDAAVYAAGLLEARTLNYTAYGNRVIVANTIAIAQMNSLQSWLTMLNTAGDDAIVLLSGKYPEMADAVAAAQQHAPQMQGELVDSGVLGALTGLSDQRSLYTIAGSQFVAFQMLRSARQEAIKDVLATAYTNEGVPQADLNPLVDSLGSAVTEEDWRYGSDGFVRIMGGQTRGRMLATVLAAQSRDGPGRDDFIGKGDKSAPNELQRGWELSTNSPFCTGQRDKLIRKGKTWITEDGNSGTLDNPGPPGYARWTSEDELVEEFYSGEDCTTVQRKRVLFGRNSFGSGPAGGSGYSGIPDYFDLDPDVLAGEDAQARMVFGIRVMRKVSDTNTSEGRSTIQATDKLNAYKAKPAGTTGELVAVAKTETFFRRDGAARLNEVSGTEERPNLFNPFWHTRLSDARPEVNAARNLQGAGGI